MEINNLIGDNKIETPIVTVTTLKSVKNAEKKAAKKSFKIGTEKKKNLVTNLKDATATKKKKEVVLSKLNLSMFESKLKNVPENVTAQKSILYNYPENWGSLQINGQIGKNWRTARRRELANFCAIIQLRSKHKQFDTLIEKVNEFKKFYKTYFRVNDFSLQSVTHTKEEKAADINFALDIVKEVLKQTEKTTAKKK